MANHDRSTVYTLTDMPRLVKDVDWMNAEIYTLRKMKQCKANNGSKNKH